MITLSPQMSFIIVGIYLSPSCDNNFYDDAKGSHLLWKYINTLSGKEKKGSRVLRLKINNEVIQDTKLIATSFNDFFKQLVDNVANVFGSRGASIKPPDPLYPIFS